MRYLWVGDARGKSTRRTALVAIVVLGVALAGVLAVAPRMVQDGAEMPGQEPGMASADWIPSYVEDVEPIFQRTCVQCHGPKRADKGLRLDSYQRMMAGDSYGTVVIPGDSSLSAIVSIVKYGIMPHGGTGLPANEIDTISRWIDAGAKED